MHTSCGRVAVISRSGKARDRLWRSGSRPPISSTHGPSPLWGKWPTRTIDSHVQARVIARAQRHQPVKPAASRVSRGGWRRRREPRLRGPLPPHSLGLGVVVVRAAALQVARLDPLLVEVGRRGRLLLGPLLELLDEPRQLAHEELLSLGRRLAGLLLRPRGEARGGGDTRGAWRAVRAGSEAARRTAREGGAERGGPRVGGPAAPRAPPACLCRARLSLEGQPARRPLDRPSSLAASLALARSSARLAAGLAARLLGGVTLVCGAQRREELVHHL
mmetsp:Transcript_24421/g.74007  ORF Transcript_24421/g.74007 Transcript_24421/m.74007 type:complete len:276 (+) Transcript_24421:1995-2822(+)